MRYNTILFDLDGTLVDSGEGILKSAEQALVQLGKPVPSPTEMRTFVGPPLRDSFMRFGCTESEAEEAIRLYRARYTTVGKFEGFVYPGIRELLEKLQAAGCRLYVATSKPENVSVEILTAFGLAPYFRYIAGAALDHSRGTKAEVIAYLLEQVGAVDGALMVGDTAYDVLGAGTHGIPTAGVTWGYGLEADMAAAGAACIAPDTEALYDFIRGN